MSQAAPATAVRLRVALAGAALLVTLFPAPAAAAPRPASTTDGTVAPALTADDIVLTPFASGLERPVFITSARDGTDRTFIVEQGGKILVRKNGVVLPTPLLDISNLVTQGGEQGLLGLAFHPSFKTNRKFFVNYTNRSGDTIIREYKTSTSNPDRTDPFSPRTVLKVDQPYTNHNGGMLAFGPDGYLYIGLGDGGSGGDPGNRAQNTGTLLGKMLRINVNGKTATRGYEIPSSNPYVGRSGRNEIWQTGLRNPWRFSFDRATGDDVDRRRGPGLVRGDRQGGPHLHGLRAGLQLGLARDGGPPLPHPLERLQHIGQGAAAHRVHAGVERALRRDRRLRVPRLADPGARRLLRVRRLLQRRDLGDQGQLVVPARADHARRHGQRAQRQQLRRERDGRAVRRRPQRHDLGHRTRQLTRRRGFPRTPRLARMPVMAGYVAMARVERGRVRALAWDEPLRVDPGLDPALPALASTAAASLEPDDAVTIGEQWDRLRDQLSMVTFYLTDPESWR